MNKLQSCEWFIAFFSFIFLIFNLSETVRSNESDSLESKNGHSRVKQYPMLMFNPCEEVKVPRSNETALSVYTSHGPVVFLCDTVTDDGRWAIIQKRNTGETNFSRNWLDYASGFGTPYTDFWLGNELINQLTSWDNYELRVDMVVQGKAYYAKYRKFKVHAAADNYRLLVDDFNGGNLEDKLSDHNGDPFSTPDRDNDETNRVHCARATGSGWWFHDCGVVNLNGRFRAAYYRFGAFWEGLEGGIEETLMKMRIRKKV